MMDGTVRQVYSVQGFIILLLISTAAFLSQSQGLNADGLAALAVLSSLHNVDLQISSTWRTSDATPCNWTGVSCRAVNANTGAPLSSVVTALELPESSAHGGYLHPSIGALSGLERISLPNLNVSGSIPAAIGNCTRLQYLDLSLNNLTGTIPDSLFTPWLSVLKLENNQIHGSIPASITTATNLTILTIHDNLISGSIPASIGRLSSLQIFRAGGNLFSGHIPSSIANCTELSILGLAFTSISGPIPDLPSSLTSINIFNTNISGSIPASLANCTSLEEIYLFSNQLSGTIPSQFSALLHLERLYLWGNNLTGSIPESFGNLESLQVMDLSQNSLSGSIPAKFGKLSSMTKLYLSLNKLSGSIPPELGNCSSLSDLQLDRNHFRGPIPAELGHLSKLTQLFLWNNFLQGSIPPSLSNCNDLQYLDFSNNQLTGPIPPQIFQLQYLSKFMVLGNQLSGEIPATIAACRSLYRLRLSQNRLSGSIPSELGQLQNLTFVDISLNLITGAIPPQLADCKGLQLLDVHGNQISGTIPTALGSLPNLQSLDVSSNMLTGLVPSELGGLSKLTKLNLAQNRLSGSIPSSLDKCRRLTMIDLSSNMFTGTIPPSLGQITTLSIALNLSCNSLSGPIPLEFSQLFALGDLDVSHNKLSGSLDVLAEMGSLVTLNISYNMFSGPLPNTFIFTSMPATNYQGNPGLCVPSSCTNSIGDPSNHPSKTRTIISSLFTTVGIMFAIAALLVWAMVRTSVQESHDIEWPWELTPFQKLNFTIDDVLDCMVDDNIVGKGCSGIVYRAEMPGGEVIAIKKIMATTNSTERDFFTTEMETLRTVRHKNIVRLLGYMTNHKVNLLLYDYMPNGSLGEFIHEKRKMIDWDTGYKIALGTAQGLAYLHHDCVPPIIHRDIKANNILLDARLEPYLADFGLAKAILNHHGATQTMLAGSYGYIAPEYAYTLSITDKSDVYSYGVVLLEILTGKRPILADDTSDGRHVTEWVHEMRHCHHDVAEILDPRLRGMPDPFVREMLQALGIALDCVHPLPEERPSMRHVVSLLTSIRHEIPDFAKLDTLAAATCPRPRTKDLIASPRLNQDSSGMPSFTAISSSSFTHSV